MIGYHALFLAIFLGTTVLFSALSIRNLHYGARTLEREREWVDERFSFEATDRVVDYQRANLGREQAQTWTVVVLVLALLYTGVAGDVARWFDGLAGSSLLTGVAFFLAIVLSLQVVSLPFDVYETFVIEERFGFNQQTPGLFLRDLLLGTLIAVVLTSIVVAGVLWTIETLTHWWLAALVLYALFSLVLLVVYPRVIAPLFNDFEPIEDGELRGAIERVFERAGFDCSEIYVMDASRRSGHSNAYFVGFGRTKRVVLFDTLVDQLELPEIEAVLAHELAHWKRKHIWKQFGAGLLRVGAILLALWYLLETTWLYEMFALPETAAVGLAVGVLWIQPLATLTSPLENRLSLAHEREADAFATDVMGEGTPLIDALCRLTSENLANPFPHPWYAAFHYTHPPIPARIRAIESLEQ